MARREIRNPSAEIVRRVMEAVRVVEKGPPPARPGSRPIEPAFMRWGKITTDWDPLIPNVVTVNPCWQDGTNVQTDREVTVYLGVPLNPSENWAGIYLRADEIIAYLPIWLIGAEQEAGLICGYAGEGDDSAPYQILPADPSTEPEAAQVDSWERADPPPATAGVDMLVQTRTAYGEAGDQKLYGFYRRMRIDSRGLVTMISAETRYTIDTPESCP